MYTKRCNNSTCLLIEEITSLFCKPMWTLYPRPSWTWDTCLKLSIRVGARMGDAAASTCSFKIRISCGDAMPETAWICSLSMFCSWSSISCVPLVTCSFSVLKTATCLTSDGSSPTASTNPTEAQGCYLVNSTGKPRCYNIQLYLPHAKNAWFWS